MFNIIYQDPINLSKGKTDAANTTTINIRRCNVYTIRESNYSHHSNYNNKKLNNEQLSPQP